MNYLLDSSIIIGYLKRVFPKEMSAFLSQLNVNRDTTFCICDMVLAEVRGGLDAREFQNVAPFLQDLKYLPSHSQIALKGGEFFYTLSHQGERIPLADCLIGATAQWHETVVVTSDKKHFQKLETYIRVIYL